ncbi:hypothetical protein [Bradyrhizobium erythrophlei]|uniref:Uncharacterized protein n=1 Tax=Bradyrhizobium erythrophlei TaxID=1437360 RepID=A0A1M5XY59_9BRAD|nr:hypothetical protein [Bradyrhizobium erythrophlei]SHI04755.1 hypothetical protein SAMN05443248_7729 [Bradyrhizobium erythrophlei]
MNEAQKYRLLMLAYHHLADGKDLIHRIANENSLVVGSTSSIGEILGTAFVSRKTFDPNDAEVVKAAFAKSGKRYPGDVISDCARVMVGLKP